MDRDLCYEILENKLMNNVDNYHIKVYSDNTVAVNIELDGNKVLLEGTYKLVAECISCLIITL